MENLGTVDSENVFFIDIPPTNMHQIARNDFRNHRDLGLSDRVFSCLGNPFLAPKLPKHGDFSLDDPHWAHDHPGIQPLVGDFSGAACSFSSLWIHRDVNIYIYTIYIYDYI